MFRSRLYLVANGSGGLPIRAAGALAALRRCDASWPTRVWRWIARIAWIAGRSKKAYF